MSDLPRVSLGFASTSFGEIVIAAHSAEELCTPAFEALIRRMADAYLGQGVDDPWEDAKARTNSILSASAGR
jgi:hypothetical protein